MEKIINDKIRYIEATESPLSADIGIIETKNGTWLFDVGSDESAISGLKGSYNIVLSHFHQDHTGNLPRLSIRDLYGSKETLRHTEEGILVTEDIYPEEGLHIFPIPSSHAKGCLGLEIDGTYAFLGDAIYSTQKDGAPVYNAQLLKEEIQVLKNLKAEYFLISHEPGLIRKKEVILKFLEEIYSLRKPGECYIYT